MTSDDSRAAYHQIVVFNALWAVAHLGHFIRKGQHMSALVWLIFFLSVALLIRPGSRVRLSLLALAQLIFWATRTPNTDNHAYIMGFVNLGILAVVVPSLWRRVGWTGLDVASLRTYVPLAMVTSYFGAALAKLNAGFFDTDVSCAVEMFHDSLAITRVGGSLVPGAFEAMLPYLVAATELAIPLLLFFRRTRIVGLFTLVGFHLAISYSPTATALDFTLVLFAIATLLMPTDAVTYLQSRASAYWTWVSARVRLDVPTVFACLLFFVLVVASWQLGNVARNRGWWLLSSAAIVLGLTICFAIRKHHMPDNVFTRTSLNAAHCAILAVLVVNIASPYLGIKTAGTFTMHSNLDAFGGQ